MKGRGRGGLIEGGGGVGACRLSSSEKGGGGGGGLIEDLRYVTFLSQHTITISSLRTRLKQKKIYKKIKEGSITGNEILRCRNFVICYLEIAFN